MRVSIKFDGGAKRFQTMSKGLEAKLMGRMNAAFIRCGSMIKNKMAEVMATGGWQANNPHYLEWKIKHGYDSRPLFRTHLLANSISFIRHMSTPAMMSAHVGWYPGAQYPGMLKSGIHKGRVPNKRKRPLPIKGFGPFSRYSTYPLERIAAYNNRTRPFIDTTFRAVEPLVIAEIQKAFYSALGVKP
jgi:hypothetical protein